MKGYAIVNGKCVSFVLSRGLAAAHKRNAGRSISASEAIMIVEGRRRIRSYYGETRVRTPGRFIGSPATVPLLRRLDREDPE